MKKIVHIKISDQNWILEKLAEQLALNLPYVSYGLNSEPNAEIQYYMTYGCREKKVSPIEMALFTHRENVQSAAHKFDNTVHEVDFCVFQSENTRLQIKDGLESKSAIISPGVDLTHFSPLVRIGIIGRTYHTGRKGEALVAQVMDIAGIEWLFTGEGWPGPANFVDHQELPNLYRSLDYVLVPSLIEGGPMCVIEALACGCKVIAPPVGWVPELPHIEFKTGDIADLRRVLIKVVEEKQELRRSVENYTWENWVQKHHALFCQLLDYNPLHQENTDIKLASVSSKHIDADAADGTEVMNVVIAVHGQEMKSSLGGPSVRAPGTVVALKKAGVNALFESTSNFKIEKNSLLHVFNVWQPNNCEATLRLGVKNQCPTVLSTIFLDLSELHFYNTKLKDILYSNNDYEKLVIGLSKLQEEILLLESKPMKEKEPFRGYFDSVRRLASYAAHIIVLSEKEKCLLNDIGINHPSVTVVKNPVSAEVFRGGDPQLFREYIGLIDYVLCVGRIEPRKNQALLALALRATKIPLVLIGHEADKSYADLIRKWGGDNVIFAGRIEPASPMLASAYAGASVFCLPSWCEGAPLVALEAAAAGCSMVLSNRSSEQEYFCDLARYVNPIDIANIREEVLAAWGESSEERMFRSIQLRQRVVQENSWEKYATKTKAVYESVMRSSDCKGNNIQSRFFFDLTTVANHKGFPTGITRVEMELAKEFYLSFRENTVFYIWNSHHDKYLVVEYKMIESGVIHLLSQRDYGTYLPGKKLADFSLQCNDVIVIFGSAWIRNSRYILSLERIKRKHGVLVCSTVHDLVERKLTNVYAKEVGQKFLRNCMKMVSLSDKVFTISHNTHRDLLDFCQQTKTPLSSSAVIRCGSAPIDLSRDDFNSKLIDGFKSILRGRKYILYVSTITERKNHKHLFLLWKRLIKNYGEDAPLLICIGRVAPDGGDILNIINDDCIFSGRVFHFSLVSDEELTWFYRNCLFTVYPSSYEGWGLPVVESCVHGKFTLASNAGSLPETAAGYAEYLDPNDTLVWYHALVKYCFDTQSLVEKNMRLGDYKIYTWNETFKTIISEVNDLVCNGKFMLLETDKVVNCSSTHRDKTLDSYDYMLNGWSEKEKSGCWTNGNTATLYFSLNKNNRNNLTLVLTGKVFSPCNEPVRISFFINNLLVRTGEFNHFQKNIKINLPLSVLGLSRNITVKIVILNPKSSSDFGGDDTRLLGFFIKEFVLVNDFFQSFNTLIYGDAPWFFSNVNHQIKVFLSKVKNRLIRIVRKISV